MCPIHCLCSFLIYVYSMTLSSLPALLKLLYFPSSWGVYILFHVHIYKASNLLIILYFSWPMSLSHLAPHSISVFLSPAVTLDSCLVFLLVVLSYLRMPILFLSLGYILLLISLWRLASVVNILPLDRIIISPVLFLKNQCVFWLQFLLILSFGYLQYHWLFLFYFHYILGWDCVQSIHQWL